MEVPTVEEYSAFQHLVLNGDVGATLRHTGFSLFKLRKVVKDLEALVCERLAEWGNGEVTITSAGERMGAGLGAALRLVNEGWFKGDTLLIKRHLAEAAMQLVSEEDRFAHMQRDYLTDGQREGPVRIPLVHLIN